ncbi:MAG: DPP IV N-terminal domain-containing protein, partial [Bryobacteraceae bacterium]
FLLHPRVRKGFLTPTRLGLGLAFATLAVGGTAEAVRAQKANFDLASWWMPAKVGRLVFDTAVTPHWLDTGDRFWYAWETSKGRSFYLVDPVKKTKVPVFDNAAMAAMLTEITRNPYEALHLPIRTIRFVKNDSAIEFEVQVSKDADINGAQTVTVVQEETGNQRRGGAGQGQGQQGGSSAEPAAAPGTTKTLYFVYDLATRKLTLPATYTPEIKKPRWASVSPDQKTIVFAKNSNLYMMDAENYAKAVKKGDDATIVETQLTTDGEEHYGYARRLTDADRDQEGQREQVVATGNQKNRRVPPIQINWSRDSKKFSVVRRDQRKVGDLWVINSLSQPRPTLETYKYAMPGEVNVDQSEIEVFDIASKARVKVKADRFKDQTLQIANARQSASARDLDRLEAEWLANGSDKLYFTRVSRDMKKMDICLANPSTGDVKTLIEERLNVYMETKPLQLINNGQELIHWSERDGWGHYYLYDGDGKLKNPITAGEFVAENISWVDEKARVIYLEAEGREPAEDPYFTHTYRVSLDGSGMKVLDRGPGSHAAQTGDSGKYFVDTYSMVNSAPQSALFDQSGARVMELESTDVSALLDAGYKYPEQIKVKADDGITDLYGVMYKPFDFDPAKKYPIVAYVYPGPQTESVTKTFTPKQPNVALAQLGFIVVEVGNRGGNPHRSKWYHSFGYGNLRDYGLADKKAAIEQLARKHSFIDIERVGIYGHSGGGFMSTAAMLVYPDFFKVAVSSSGNHENNIYNRRWSEMHHGVKEITDKDGKVTFEYSIDKNSELAKNLKGHLMLATGDMDDNVHPGNTLRLADALIKANKRFDMVVLPGIRHPYAADTEYFFWVRAEYFAKHLIGAADRGADIVEINREREQTGTKGRAAAGQAQGQGRRRP